jgi:FMN phosphatase YigB (HAD superfamily)
VIAIGDRFNSDVLGAINAGIDSIWYNPERKPGKREITPTLEIADLRDLLNIFPPINE